LTEAVVHGFVRNGGQVCSAHTRLLVQESIKERLLEKVIARAKTHRPGDPLDEGTTLGPLSLCDSLVGRQIQVAPLRTGRSSPRHLCWESLVSLK